VPIAVQDVNGDKAKTVRNTIKQTGQKQQLEAKMWQGFVKKERKERAVNKKNDP
jgi:hypothetical protein